MKLLGITAPFTGSGKTTVTLAISEHLRNSAVFKIGPDFIDTGLARSITGYAENIDRYLEGKNYKKLICEASKKYDYGIFEGVMGLHDSGLEFDNSTYYYFRRLGIPHLIVIDVSRLAENAYYIFKGMRNSLTLGVILNNYHGEKHLRMVEREFIKHNVRIYGRIPFKRDISIEERHLGLKTFMEMDDLKNKIKVVKEYMDFEFLEYLPDFSCNHNENFVNQGKNILVAMDRAFNFYYQYNLNLLSRIGNLKFFSPLKNESFDDGDFIYIGGGYPELYKEELERSNKTRESIIDAFNNNKIIYGECGGLMYLMEKIDNGKGEYKMVGLFPGNVRERSGLVLGYTELIARRDYFIFRKGDMFRGHEFHYSSIESDGPFALEMRRGKGIDGRDGLYRKNAFGSYTHIHFFPYRERIYRFIRKI
ncbi:MAG: cobyrinate a,c-diamide synthase [Thermoplasmata archaeon]